MVPLGFWPILEEAASSHLKSHLCGMMLGIGRDGTRRKGPAQGEQSSHLAKTGRGECWDGAVGGADRSLGMGRKEASGQGLYFVGCCIPSPRSTAGHIVLTDQ